MLITVTLLGLVTALLGLYMWLVAKNSAGLILIILGAMALNGGSLALFIRFVARLDGLF